MPYVCIINLTASNHCFTYSTMSVSESLNTFIYFLKFSKYFQKYKFMVLWIFIPHECSEPTITKKKTKFLFNIKLFSILLLVVYIHKYKQIEIQTVIRVNIHKVSFTKNKKKNTPVIWIKFIKVPKQGWTRQYPAVNFIKLYNFDSYEFFFGLPLCPFLLETPLIKIVKICQQLPASQE